jgi:hypothetical protein
MSRPLFVKVNNTWKEGVPYIKVGNTWKQITKLSTKVSGVWQPWKLEESHEHIYTISYAWNSNKCTAKAVCSCGDQITETKTGTYRKRTTATCCQVLVYDYYVNGWQNSHVFSGPKYSPDYYGEKDYTNHTGLNSFDAQEATCTSSGWKAHSCCSDCGKYYDANGTETTWEKLVIPKDPNKHSKVTTSFQSKDNYQHGTLNKCSACKAEWWTDTANHTWQGDDRYGYACTGGCGSTVGPCKHLNVTSTGADATCTTDGYWTYTCNDCGHTWSETQPHTGHSNYVEIESNGNGTHSKVQYCEWCDYRRVVSSQACSADTCEGTTCKSCGATITAAGHSYGAIQYSPVGTTQHYRYKECTRDGCSAHHPNSQTVNCTFSGAITYLGYSASSHTYTQQCANCTNTTRKTGSHVITSGTCACGYKPSGGSGGDITIK